MKNLANILLKATISPKERVTTLLSNDIYKEKNGKNILSESEIYCLTQGWKPKSTYERNEYNKYLDGSQIENRMRTEIQFDYLQALLMIERVSRILDYVMFSGYKNSKRLEILLLNSTVTETEALDFIIKHSGFNYDYVVQEFPEIQTEIDELIETKKLTILTSEEQVVDTIRTVKVITGESISTLSSTHMLKIEYDKQITYYKYFAYVFLFVQQADLFKIYSELLDIQEIYKVLVSIYEVDIDYYLESLINEVIESIDQLNKEILYLLARMEDYMCENQPSKFFLEIDVKEILFNKNQLDYHSDIYNRYLKEFSKLFYYEFKSLNSTD